MKIKAIIFDLWGTLAYTEPHIGQYIETINKLIGKEHIELFTKLRREWYKKNVSSDDFFSDLITKTNLDPSKKNNLIESWEEQAKHANLFPETLEVLKELKDKGLKLALITNTTPITELAIKKLDINHFFDCILYSFKEGVTKPNKILFEKALKDLNVKTEEVIVVGDQLDTDKVGADSINAEFLLIDWFDKYKDYKGNKLKTLKEILRIIQKT